MKFKLKAFALISLVLIAQSSFCMNPGQRLKSTAKAINSRVIVPIYHADAIRTCILRMPMVFECLYDGECNTQDAMVIMLTLASVLTVFTYTPEKEKCSKVLPKELNLLAHLVAMVTSTDGSNIPITDTNIEAQIRFIFGCLSMLATGTIFLF